MTTVYLDGLSNKEIFKMLSRMLIILFMFSSQGSGWTLRKENRLKIWIATFAPVHALSYMVLRGFLNGCRSLSNIRNHFDHICLLYCFIKNRINLLTDRRSNSNCKDESRYVQECGTTASWRLNDTDANIQDPVLWNANEVYVDNFGLMFVSPNSQTNTSQWTFFSSQMCT